MSWGPANLPMDEQLLLQRLRQRDAAAFAHLVDTHHGSLLRLARSFVSSQAVAEEVVQETWLGVITGLAAFEGRSSLRTWIFRILTNRAKTRGVKEKRSVPFSAFEEDGEDAVDPTRFGADGMWSRPPVPWEHQTPHSILANKEARMALEKGIDALPPAQAAVVTLRDVVGMDAEETCSALDISETNQRVLLHRARSRLRTLLEPHLEPR